MTNTPNPDAAGELDKQIERIATTFQPLADPLKLWQRERIAEVLAQASARGEARGRREAVSLGGVSPKKANERVTRLKRRAEWLADRHGATHAELTFDKAEESALRWAIAIIEYNLTLDTGSQSKGGENYAAVTPTDKPKHLLILNTGREILCHCTLNRKHGEDEYPPAPRPATTAVCEQCDGVGHDDYAPCHKCNGSGIQSGGGDA